MTSFENTEIVKMIENQNLDQMFKMRLIYKCFTHSQLVKHIIIGQMRDGTNKTQDTDSDDSDVLPMLTTEHPISYFCQAQSKSQ